VLANSTKSMFACFQLLPPGHLHGCCWALIHQFLTSFQLTYNPFFHSSFPGSSYLCSGLPCLLWSSNSPSLDSKTWDFKRLGTLLQSLAGLSLRQRLLESISGYLPSCSKECISTLWPVVLCREKRRRVTPLSIWIARNWNASNLCATGTTHRKHGLLQHQQQSGEIIAPCKCFVLLISSFTHWQFQHWLKRNKSRD